MLVKNYAIAHGLSTIVGVFDKNDPRYSSLYDIGHIEIRTVKDPADNLRSWMTPVPGKSYSLKICDETFRAEITRNSEASVYIRLVPQYKFIHHQMDWFEETFIPVLCEKLDTMQSGYDRYTFGHTYNDETLTYENKYGNSGVLCEDTVHRAKYFLRICNSECNFPGGMLMDVFGLEILKWPNHDYIPLGQDLGPFSISLDFDTVDNRIEWIELSVPLDKLGEILGPKMMPEAILNTSTSSASLAGRVSTAFVDMLRIVCDAQETALRNVTHLYQEKQKSNEQ